jgi:hypothetical protein
MHLPPWNNMSEHDGLFLKRVVLEWHFQLIFVCTFPWKMSKAGCPEEHWKLWFVFKEMVYIPYHVRDFFVRTWWTVFEKGGVGVTFSINITESWEKIWLNLVFLHGNIIFWKSSVKFTFFSEQTQKKKSRWFQIIDWKFNTVNIWIALILSKWQ